MKGGDYEMEVPSRLPSHIRTPVPPHPLTPLTPEIMTYA